MCTGLGAAGQYPLRPVYGDILRLQAPHPLVEHVVRGFVNGRPVYVIPRPGGEVCIGATSREDTRTRPGVDGVYQLLKDAIRVVPVVEECELIESNVGVRPGTPDDLPIFGDRTTATGRRQLISNGYFGTEFYWRHSLGKPVRRCFWAGIFRQSSRPAPRKGLSTDTRYCYYIPPVCAPETRGIIHENTYNGELLDIFGHES